MHCHRRTLCTMPARQLALAQTFSALTLLLRQSACGWHAQTISLHLLPSQTSTSEAAAEGLLSR